MESVLLIDLEAFPASPAGSLRVWAVAVQVQVRVLEALERRLRSPEESSRWPMGVVRTASAPSYQPTHSASLCALSRHGGGCLRLAYRRRRHVKQRKPTSSESSCRLSSFCLLYFQRLSELAPTTIHYPNPVLSSQRC